MNRPNLYFLMKYAIKGLSIILILLIFTSCVHRIEYQDVPLKPKEPTRDIYNANIALVLGGGGTKGFAHLGVIEVLEKSNIPIDLIVGTSAGSIVGALYADNANINITKKKFFSVSKKDILDQSLASAIYGPVRGEYLKKFLNTNVNSHDIEKLKIAFVAVATSLETNKSFIFRSGPVIPAVHASSALPGIFTPVYVYGQHLIDGGATEPVPVVTARKFSPKLVIAVDITTSPQTTKDYSKVSIAGGYNAIGLAYHAFNIAYYQLASYQSNLADITIRPDLSNFHFLDDTHKLEMYERGKYAAKKALPIIQKKIKELNMQIR